MEKKFKLTVTRRKPHTDVKRRPCTRTPGAVKPTDENETRKQDKA